MSRDLTEEEKKLSGDIDELRLMEGIPLSQVFQKSKIDDSKYLFSSERNDAKHKATCLKNKKKRKNKRKKK